MCKGKRIVFKHQHKTGFVQETRHKYQGLFKDFPAPNLMFSRTILF